MRQLTYVGGNTIEWWDLPAPKLETDRDALVQPLAVTRCDLDLTIVSGKSGLPGPFALGHETAGRVVAIGDAVKNFAPDDLVIVPFQISYGICQRMYGDFTDTSPVPLRHMYGVGITLRVSRVNVRAELPGCVGHVESGRFHPEHVITRRVRFEDAHEAIGDPTIRVAFVRDGIE